MLAYTLLTQDKGARAKKYCLLAASSDNHYSLNFRNAEVMTVCML